MKGGPGGVVYVGSFDFPRRNAAAQLVDATARALSLAGVRVSVVARTTEESQLHSETVIGNGVAVSLAARATKPGSMWEALRMARAVATLLRSRRADVVVAYNASSPLLIMMLILGRARRAVVIAHCTEWYEAPPLRPRLIKSIVKRLDIALRMRVLHWLVDGLIVSSRYLQEYYSGKPTLVVPTLSPRPAKVHRAVHRSLRPLLVYAGMPFQVGIPDISERWMKDRLDVAIDWLSLLRGEAIEFAFNIYGITREEYLLSVPRHQESIDSVDGVVFHGRVSHEAVAEALIDADYTLLVRDVSRTTLAGFPTKVTESLIAGTPPIASAVGDTPLYIEHGVDGFLLSSDPVVALDTLRTALMIGPTKRAVMKANSAQNRLLVPEAWSESLAAFLLDIKVRARK